MRRKYWYLRYVQLSKGIYEIILHQWAFYDRDTGERGIETVYHVYLTHSGVCGYASDSRLETARSLALKDWQERRSVH